MHRQAWPPHRIAIVYDRVNTRHGGAELVLSTLHTLFPTADLLTSLVDLSQAEWAKVFPKVVPSWLQHIPYATHMHRWLASFMPLAFETLPLQDYDLVISVSSAEAKGVITTTKQLHVCYLLSPPRYLYHQREELLAAAWWTRIPGLAWLARIFLKYLYWWDQIAMQRPDAIIPLSFRVSEQVRQFYSTPPQQLLPPIYPPIISHLENTIADQKALPESLRQLIANKQPYFLQVGRLVSYKRAELSLLAAAAKKYPCVIVGEGPEKTQLVALANALQQQMGAQLFIIGAVTPATLTQLYQHCSGLLMPGEEDFGLTPLEANAFGKPAIVNSKAGSAELIEDAIHGIHLATQTPEELSLSMEKLLSHHWNPQLLRQNAEKYGTSIFVARFATAVERLWQEHQNRQ